MKVANAYARIHFFFIQIKVFASQKQKSTGTETLNTRYYVSKQAKDGTGSVYNCAKSWRIGSRTLCVFGRTFNEDAGKLHEKRHAQNFQAKLRHILSVCLYDSMRADQTRTP